ncbi:MAG TPA: hypothetical protein VN807_04895 [Candidatus Sulfotelmatobacter sp.]|nr:hypothetical protein [Candidatus Sulfotelmatobacter sp.]
MTADEIRKMRDDTVSGRIDGSLTEESASVFFLAEIAAQLAELNAQRQDALLEVGDEMATHYQELINLLSDDKIIPPSIRKWAILRQAIR